MVNEFKSSDNAYFNKGVRFSKNFLKQVNISKFKSF